MRNWKRLPEEGAPGRGPGVGTGVEQARRTQTRAQLTSPARRPRGPGRRNRWGRLDQRQGVAGTSATGQACLTDQLRTVKAYPVPEGQEAPEPSVSSEVGETTHETSQNAPQARLAVGESQAVRQNRTGNRPSLHEPGRRPLFQVTAVGSSRPVPLSPAALTPILGGSAMRAPLHGPKRI